MSNHNRVQPGVREGGQFSATLRGESDISLASTARPDGVVTEDDFQAYSGRIRAAAELNSRAETRLMVAAVADQVRRHHPQDDTLIVHDYGNGSDPDIVGSTGPHGQVHTRDDTPALKAGRTQFELGRRLGSDWGRYRLEDGSPALEEVLPPREPRGRRDPSVRVRTLPIAPIKMRPGYTDPVDSVLDDEREDGWLVEHMSPEHGTVYGFTLDGYGDVDEVRLDTGCHQEPTEEDLARAREHVQSVLDDMPDNTRTGTRWVQHADTGAPLFVPHIGVKER
ncbi:hypothetical protein LG293_17240 (plasmid) [Citricoccus nitrophenolicus]